MERDRKIFLLKKALGPIRDDKSFKGDLLFTCPKCKHHKNKLCVSIERECFHCWNCGYGHRSSIESLLWHLEENRAAVLEEYRGSLQGKEPAPKKFDVPRLPQEAFSLLSDRDSIYVKHARAYLRQRRVTERQVTMHRLMFAEEGRYANRIIVPSFDRNGELNFFVGRSIYPGTVRYMHGQFDKDIIFNELLIDWARPIVLTEGPFDAFVAGSNAIPLQGKHLDTSSNLFKAIMTMQPPVYLALDADARKHRLSAARALMAHGIECYDVPLNGKKDLGEMTEDECARAISSAKRLDSEINMLRARMTACA